MKTKIVSLIIALAGLNINAALADNHAVNGNLGVKLTSDYSRRGELVTSEAVQAQLGLNSKVSNVDLFANFFTNRSTENERDSNEIIVGAGTAFLNDLVTTYGGLYNTDFSDAEANLDYFLQVQVNAPLSPSVSFYRSIDSELNTFEGSLSQDFDLKVVNLEISGVVGNTELSTTNDSTYTGVTLEVSKEINGANVYADISVSDNDSRDYETIYGVGVQFNF